MWRFASIDSLFDLGLLVFISWWGVYGLRCCFLGFGVPVTFGLGLSVLQGLMGNLLLC